MIDARIEELMWLEIDETISPSDRESLRAYLERHPESREHFQQLRQMALLFGQVGEIDPPSELRERILRGLETAVPPSARQMGVFEWLRALLTPRPVWKLAAAAAAGAFIGVLGYHVVRYGLDNAGSFDKTPFYGAMNIDEIGRNGPVVHIDVPGATGALTVRRDETRVLADLDVSSEKEIEVVLEYRGAPLEFAVGKLTDHPSNQVAVQDGEVRVRNRGRGAYRVLFALHEDPTSPITVRVLSEGSVLFERGVSPSHAAAKR
jgi:hypothetical protein